jgi:hypothetical protein
MGDGTSPLRRVAGNLTRGFSPDGWGVRAKALEYKSGLVRPLKFRTLNSEF